MQGVLEHPHFETGWAEHPHFQQGPLETNPAPTISLSKGVDLHATAIIESPSQCIGIENNKHT